MVRHSQVLRGTCARGLYILPTTLNTDSPPTQHGLTSDSSALNLDACLTPVAIQFNEVILSWLDAMFCYFRFGYTYKVVNFRVRA